MRASMEPFLQALLRVQLLVQVTALRDLVRLRAGQQMQHQHKSSLAFHL